MIISLYFFTGVKESDVAGNLAFSMLLLGFPSSIIAYPMALMMTDWFEASNIFVYNSRLLLFLWWLIFFIFGLIQWFIIGWIFRSRKPKKDEER